MKFLHLFFLLLMPFALFSQSFEYRSNKIKLDIRIPPPDTTSPVMNLSFPERMEGFPLYVRDTIYSLRGELQDNSDQIEIAINDKKYGIFSSGPVRIDIKLKYGENKLVVTAADRKNNIVTQNVIVFQDPNADINPPLIKILDVPNQEQRGIKVVHKNQNQDGDNRFILKGKIQDESGILGVWVNGLKVDSLNNDEFSFDFGFNRPEMIHIKAADVYGNISYDSISTAPVQTALSDMVVSGKFYALIIGIEDYLDQSLPDLEYPVHDCQELINVLEGSYNFEKKNVTFLKNPSRTTIINTFADFRKHLTENDNLLIFYAGHGYWDKEIEQGYWLPIDATNKDISNWITNSTVRDYIRGIKAKHTLLIADACFSGSIFTGRDTFLDADASVKETYKYTCRKAITSGMLETVTDKSVFVNYLIKRLQNNKEKYLKALDLYVGLRDAVINNSPNHQKPLYGVIQGAGDESTVGDFIFIRNVQ